MTDDAGPPSGASASPSDDRARPADDLAWETLDSTIDYNCPGFDVRLDHVRFPDGSDGEFHSVTEPESVVVLPFTPDDEVVVVAEWRQAVGRVSRGLPAGTREPDDRDLHETARRELTEETGYVAESVEELLVVEPLNGVADAVHHYYVASGCRPDGDQDLDHNESIRVETTTFPALRERVLDGDVRDGRTVLGTLFYDRARSDAAEGG